MALTPIILQSTLARDRTRLVFRHTEGGSVFGPFVEHRPSGEDHNAFVFAHAAGIEANRTEMELRANEQNAVSDDAPNPTFVYSTQNQFRSRLRELFRNARNYVLCRLAWYINQLNLTDNQLKSLFSVNDAQLTTLKNRLNNLAAKYVAMRDEVGE